MKQRASKQELIQKIKREMHQDVYDEEAIHLLLGRKLTDEAEQPDQNASFGQRAADRLARFAGSWTFILLFSALLIGWMLFNILALSLAFDPFPFILLNLVLSCVAAIQAPLIMMSQNRQEQKDRRRAENDYKINLKSEIILEDLHQKMDALLQANGLDSHRHPPGPRQ